MKNTYRIDEARLHNRPDLVELLAEIEGLPLRSSIRVVHPRRHRLRDGLPMEELERISVQRLWEPLAGIPRNPFLPDDFEPALPEEGGHGV